MDQVLNIPVAANTALSPAAVRLGFVGVGWIGLNRMQLALESERARAAAICDPSPECLRAAIRCCPDAIVCESLEDLLQQPLDGIVIATPSAMHSAQATKALSRGLPVFCQKPLARTFQETQSVISGAKEADRLLHIDFSYRFTRGIEKIRKIIRSGELGEIFAADLTFHNAYGPGKKWFYDRSQSGGGCLMDLGSHLVDLVFWLFGGKAWSRVSSHIRSAGKPLHAPFEEVEDYVTAEVDLQDGPSIRLACSWNLHAGQDAVINVEFHGTRGSVCFHNVNGSFYDFQAEHRRGTSRTALEKPPDDWSGRALIRWIDRLAQSPAYDPEIEQVLQVSELMDEIYARA